MQKKTGSNEYVLAIVLAVALSAVLIGGMNALGFATKQDATASVSVTGTTSITLTTSTVNLGSMAPGVSNETAGNVPPALNLSNNGNVKVNVTINATDLWSTSVNPSANYKFAANSTDATACYQVGSTTTLTNMPAAATATQFLDWLNFTDSCDYAEIEIYVTVPAGEPTGAKSSTVTFIASQA